MVNITINMTDTREGGDRCRIRRWFIGILVVSGTCLCIYTYNTASFQMPAMLLTVTQLQHLFMDYTMFVPADLGGNKFEWSPYMDVLDETTALKDPPLHDINRSVNINNSKVYILGDRTSYEVGDSVAVRIDLFDGYGKRRYRGGDQLRVRSFEESLNNSAAGYVIDHQNGSYTAMVRCLWAGTPNILVYISYTREAVRALYHIRDQLPSTRDTYVNYKDKEIKRCHPFTTKLKSANLCNLTSINDNMSWYCEAPTSPGSSCSYAGMAVPTPYEKLPITAAEETLFQRNGEHLTPVLRISVKETVTNPKKVETKTPCYLFNRTKLWFLASPVGHFRHGQWQTEHCQMTPVKRFSRCLRNKHIFLYGDSTIRQWFQNIQERFNCTLKTEAWTDVKWKKDSMSFCPQINLTISWILHAFPGNVSPSRTQVKSGTETMIKFAKDTNAIFVIHMLTHLSAYHHSVFRNRMANIRENVETILKLNKDAKILIKGGHTFRDFRQVSDYYGYIFRIIQLEEFKQLYDKVVYLDNKDITIAQDVIPNHPPRYIDTQMVNQLLGYICE